jgi:E3 ubiquitin-protein ligase DOA10
VIIILRGTKLGLDNNALKGGLKDNTKTVAVESGKACRICLDDMDDDDNPFITPCKCAGSMKFIHLSCLREW